MKVSPIALIVAGPTCSGKSALALKLAQRFRGAVINADSMQVYKDLHVLTARPDEKETGLITHKLYGVLDGASVGNVAWWRKEAFTALQQCQKEGFLPVFCGGTGMYFRALLEGLVEIPDPGMEARLEARSLLAEKGSEWLHTQLKKVDPETASDLHSSDSQRIARAWEVWRGTGRGLTAWRKQPQLPPASCRFLSIRLDPDREILRKAIARRFANMLRGGALDEVRSLMKKDLAPTLPIMRAHGVPELVSVLKGTLSLQEAEEKAVIATGQYTRRQATWFRHHLLGKEEDNIISLHRFGDNEKYSERELDKIENFITQRIDISFKNF